MTLPFLKSAPGDAVVIVEGEFNAGVERLYRAWTDAGELSQWFGPSKGALLDVNVTPSVGGQICFEFASTDHRRSAVEGHFLELQANEKIVFTWAHIVVRADGEKTETPQSTVTVTFQAIGERTRIRLCHEGIATQDGRDSVCHGWSGTLEQLQSYIVANA